MSQTRRSILIVDDNPEDYELYRRYLRQAEDYDYTLLNATSGQAGLEQWQHHQPDVVLLDYWLPDMDGQEFLAAMQAQTKQTVLPVIMATGQGNEAIAVQAMKAGAQDYLVKGQITPEGLRLAIHRTIESVQLRTQLQHELVERRQVEQALRRANTRLELAASAVNCLIYEWDLHSQTVERSQGLFQLLGYTPEEAEPNAHWWTSRIHPDDLQPIHNHFVANLSTLDRFANEYRIRHRDGHYIWIEDRSVIVRDQSGQPSQIIGCSEDISDRKRSEQVLKESEERFRTSVENMLDCFGVYRAVRNAQGQIVDFQIEYVNNAACLNNRMTREQQVGHGLCELMPRYRENGLFEAYCQVVETGQPLTQDALLYANESEEPSMRAFDIHATRLGDGFVATWRDVTERKQTETALQASQAQLQQQLAEIEAIYQTAPIGLNVIDTDLRFVRINQRLAEMNGYSIAEHLGRTVQELLPELADAAESILRSVINTGEPLLNVEIRGETPAQPGVTRIWIEQFLPLKDGDRIIGISTVCEEITERKQAEAALRESEERFRDLADNIAQLAWMTDEHGSIFWYNRRWFEYTGTTLDEMQGWGWQAVQHPEHLERVVKKFRASMETGETWEDTFPLRGKDGQYRWFLSRAIPIRDEQGQVLRWFGTNTDITDRLQAETTLRESKERLTLLYETVSDLLSTEQPMTLMDTLFRKLSAQMDLHSYFHFMMAERNRHPMMHLVHYSGVSDADASALEWMGLGEGMCGLVAQHRRQIVLNQDQIAAHPNAQVISTLQATAYAGQPLMAQGRLLGTLSFISHTRTHFTREETDLLQAISDQVAIALERSALITSLQQRSEQLAQANRIKDEFLAVLSHELRSPLNPILGWSKLLQTRKFDETKTMEALETIERNAKLQAQLIDDLLDVAKILRGKLSLQNQPVNLAFVIESALDTVRTAALAKSISLHPVLPDIGQVLGDAVRLQQITWNLLSNAIKFTPDGGWVQVMLESDELETSTPHSSQRYAQITVSDNGKGINSDFLPHIFESFRQEDVSTTRKHGGLGLGLAIVRQLVEAHGGNITADSPGVGQGATFTVRLPLLNGNLAIAPNPQQREQELDLTGVRVLTVDDEPDSRELLTVLLMQHGAKVVAADSAAQVLSSLATFQPHVLISDIGMPNVDGYSLIQQIRALPPERGGKTPAIALTAYAAEVDQQRALTAGFQQHLTKPIDPNQLLQAVVRLL